MGGIDLGTNFDSLVIGGLLSEKCYNYALYASDSKAFEYIWQNWLTIYIS